MNFKGVFIINALVWVSEKLISDYNKDCAEQIMSNYWSFGYSLDIEDFNLHEPTSLYFTENVISEKTNENKLLCHILFYHREIYSFGFAIPIKLYTTCVTNMPFK